MRTSLFVALLALFALASAQQLLPANSGPFPGSIARFQYSVFKIPVYEVYKGLDLRIDYNGTSAQFLYLGFDSDPNSAFTKLENTDLTKVIIVPKFNSTDKPLFLNVYGYMAGSFVVTATAQSTEGTVYSSSLGSARADYYTFTIPPQVFTVEIAAVSNAGDLDLFASVNAVPTKEKYQYADAATGLTSCIKVVKPVPSGTWYVLALNRSNFQISYRIIYYLNGPGTCALLKYF